MDLLVSVRRIPRPAEESVCRPCRRGPAVCPNHRATRDRRPHCLGGVPARSAMLPAPSPSPKPYPRNVWPRAPGRDLTVTQSADQPSDQHRGGTRGPSPDRNTGVAGQQAGHLPLHAAPHPRPSTRSQPKPRRHRTPRAQVRPPQRCNPHHASPGTPVARALLRGATTDTLRRAPQEHTATRVHTPRRCAAPTQACAHLQRRSAEGRPTTAPPS